MLKLKSRCRAPHGLVRATLTVETRLWFPPMADAGTCVPIRSSAWSSLFMGHPTCYRKVSLYHCASENHTLDER